MIKYHEDQHKYIKAVICHVTQRSRGNLRDNQITTEQED